MEHSHTTCNWTAAASDCCAHPAVTHFINPLNHSLAVNICNAPLVPSWFLAVVIGTCFGCKFCGLGRQVTGSLAYSITYFMYAIMITSGLVVHCLYLVECGAQQCSQGYINAGNVDVSLTSCIAISFAFDGLIDLKLIPERSYSTIMMMTSLYGLIFSAYFLKWVSTLDLYFYSIMICCSFYMLTRLIRLVLDWSHIYWSEVLCLIIAGVSGGGSLLLIKSDSCWLCKTFGPWSVEGVWYYGSDVSMLFLGVYIWKSLTRESLTKNSWSN